MSCSLYKTMIRNILVAFAITAVFVESTDLIIKRSTRNVDTCGIPKAKLGLIVSGQDFTRGAFPWIVALTHTGFRPPKFFCAGTLISKTFVISGKYCESN